MRTSDNFLILIDDCSRTNIVLQQQFEMKYKIVHISPAFKKIVFIALDLYLNLQNPSDRPFWGAKGASEYGNNGALFIKWFSVN